MDKTNGDECDDTDSDKKTINTETDAKQDTIICIEDSTEKPTVAQVLKDAICTNDGLHDISVHKSEACKPRPELMIIDYGNKSHRNVQWVQLMENAEGVEMPEGDRKPFIRKVFFILTICVAITTFFLFLTIATPGGRDFFRSMRGRLLVGLASIALLPVSYIMCCCPKVLRCFPCNWICMFVMVAGYTVIVAFVTSRYKLTIVFIALIVTCGVVALCFLLAFTSIDFTSWMMYVVVIGFALMGLALALMVASMVYKTKFTGLQLLLCIGFTLYHSVCFIMEIQMILGGKTVELSVHDYVLGVLMLYSSIITLFLNIIKMLGLIEEFLGD